MPFIPKSAHQQMNDRMKIRRQVRAALSVTGKDMLMRVRQEIHNALGPHVAKQFDEEIGEPMAFINRLAGANDPAAAADMLEHLGDISRHMTMNVEALRSQMDKGIFAKTLIEKINERSALFRELVTMPPQGESKSKKLSERAADYWMRHPRTHTLKIDVMGALYEMEGGAPH